MTVLSGASFAQKENALIRKGNTLYKQNQVDQSQKQYQKAVNAAPANPTANYNLGNADFKKNDFDNAVKSYEASLQNTDDKAVQQKAWYNKGLALMKQKKLEESIDAWKKAVLLNPEDVDARENLQKALMEQKQKQPPPPPKDDKKQDKKNQDQQPKQQQSRLTKQQVEQLLKALEQKEKEVQEKMNQNKTKSLTQPDKDW